MEAPLGKTKGHTRVRKVLLGSGNWTITSQWERTDSTQHHLGKDNRHWYDWLLNGNHKSSIIGDFSSSDMPSEHPAGYQWWLSQALKIHICG